MEKAQKELDSVLSDGQLPDFADEGSLPYITAVVKETLRWRDVAPIGAYRTLRMSLQIYRLRSDSCSPSP